MPESVAWIDSTTPSIYDPAPDPADMLRWNEDIEPMLDHAKNERDRAAIALQFDAGLRGGEFADLTVGSIAEHRHGLQVTVQGKQGQRSVTMIPSTPYVEQWLKSHPGEGDPDAPLWSKVTSPEGISRPMMYRMFQDPAKCAGIQKPVTPTNFRKSSASWCGSKGLNQAYLEDRYGWVRGSKVASRYVAIFSEDKDNEYARLYGKEVEAEESPEDRSPVECPNCSMDTPRSKDICVWCEQAI